MKKKSPFNFEHLQDNRKMFLNFNQQEIRKLYEKKLENSDEQAREQIRRHMEFHRNLVRQVQHKNDVRHFARVARFLVPISMLLNVVGIVALLLWLGLSKVAILALVCMAIFGIFITLARGNFEKRMIRPIEKLKKAMEEVANGNLNTEIEVNIRSDIGLLLSSFNIMVAKLRENEKVKQAYEENRKLLIANISHDLKTPITAIEGYIEAILDKTVTTDEKRDQYLEVIHKNATYMNQLIDDLFLFSKLDMQKLDFHFESISINAFMRDLAEEYEFEFAEKGLTFIFQDNTQQEEIIAMDRKRFSQAIRNIITNSMKYGENDELRVVITLNHTKENIQLCIADNGIGIAAENIEKIFDRFYRVENARTKNLSSTGLGLSIAKELIEAMEGTIMATSEVGQGTMFTINFRKA